MLYTSNENCNQCKPDTNFDKTEVMIFGDRFRRNRNVIVNGHQIEVVYTFKYLGILFSKTRRFTSARNI